MKKCDQKKILVNKISGMKTFAVPHSLEEIKENITFNTKISSKFSKEKIINQAIKLHQEGNIIDAKKYYQHCLNQGFKDPRVFLNYGSILINSGNLQEAERSIRKAIDLNPDLAIAHSNLGNVLRALGKSQDAELSIRKAIKINPNLAEAHSNLGNTLRDLGNLQEAESSLRKAILLKPDFAKAHSNLGNILRDLGNLQEAEISTRKAIEIQSNYSNAHLNLGNILNDLGKSNEAFECYLKAIEINPKLPNIYFYITRFLKDSDPSKLDKSKLKNILNLLLERENINHKELFKAFNFLHKNEIIGYLKKSDTDFSCIELFKNNTLIINALKKIIFKDPQWERLLIKLRKDMCALIAQKKADPTKWQLKLFIALAEQCFSNEYIYAISEDEKLFLEKIIFDCKEGKSYEINLSLLACYFPLYTLIKKIPSILNIKSNDKNFKELLKSQL